MHHTSWSRIHQFKVFDVLGFCNHNNYSTPSFEIRGICHLLLKQASCFLKLLKQIMYQYGTWKFSSACNSKITLNGFHGKEMGKQMDS